MTKNPDFHSRTKHIDIRYHFINDHTTRVDIELMFFGIRDQIADVRTNALPKATHDQFHQKLGVCNFESRGSVEY